MAITFGNTATVQSILTTAGMPKDLATNCEIEEDKEGNLSVTFKLTFPNQRICFLKFHEREGARGGPFIKHLLPISDESTQKHAEKRRRFLRKVLESIVLYYRPTLVPRPLYFDLSDDSMGLEKTKAKQGVFAEFRVGTSIPRLEGLVGTLWEGLELDHLPLSVKGASPHDPIHYSPEMVRRCTAGLGELQREAAKVIEEKIQKKEGTPETNRLKLEEKLKHEQRSLIGYPQLAKELSDTLGDVETFPMRGKMLIKEIQDQCQIEFNDSSIEGCQQKFLHEVTIPEKFRELPFNKQVFLAEKERWWSQESLFKGKRLAQLKEAYYIAQALLNQDQGLLEFVEFLQGFKATYLRMEKLEKSVVPQDGHPFNFFTNREDGKTSMLDLEDLSIGARFADLSTVYLYKILRAYLNKKISKDDATALIHATLDGYNSEASHPLTKEELACIVDYNLAIFLNHFSQIGLSLRRNPNELNSYNLAVTLSDFLSHFNLLRSSSEVWEKEFLSEF